LRPSGKSYTINITVLLCRNAHTVHVPCRSGYAFAYRFDVRKNFETGGTNHTEQTSKLIYDNDPTAAAAVLSMAFVIVIYRIESISINSEKEEKI
jgi:hypothetical protein